MRMHAIFCVLQQVIVAAGFAFYFWFNYLTKNFGNGGINKIYGAGSILESLSYALLYGYIGYLVTTLSAPEDVSKSQNVVRMLQRRNSYTLEDEIYQAEGLETIKAIIGQFLMN